MSLSQPNLSLCPHVCREMMVVMKDAAKGITQATKGTVEITEWQGCRKPELSTLTSQLCISEGVDPEREVDSSKVYVISDIRNQDYWIIGFNIPSYFFTSAQYPTGPVPPTWDPLRFSYSDLVAFFHCIVRL